ITPSYIESNIRVFVRQIKKVAPLIRKVLLSMTFSFSDIPQVYEHHWGSLVKQLGQLADNVEYKIYSRPMRLEMQPTGLSYLMYADMDKKNDDSTLVLQIARRSASTLQYLCIQFSKLNNISPLIQSAAGDVQYPCLHTLRLEAAATFSLTKLQHLTIETEYCFGDDTPFRGNARSLLYLNLNLGPKVVEILKTHGVFTPLSHPKLHCLRLGQRSLPEQKLFTTNAEYIRYVLCIGPHAPVRDIKCSLHTPLFKSLVPVFGEYAKIQVLELPNTPLTFWDVIELTKALPLLSDLRTCFSPGSDLPDDLAEAELPAYVCKNYYPAGKRFRCWQLLILQGQSFEFAAKSVLLLALACPSFDYAAVPAANRPLFMAHMKKMITANEFKVHAPRLRRLLFGGWKNKITSGKAAQPEMDLMSLLTALTAPASRVPEYNAFYLVTSLEIKLHAWEVYTGEALSLLSAGLYSGVAFPVVSRLSIVLYFSGNRHGGFLPSNTEFNIGELVRRIKEMVPSVGHVVVNTQGGSTDGGSIRYYYFRLLVLKLIEISPMTAPDDPHGEVGYHIYAEQIHGFVKVTSPASRQALLLARQSAQTLQNLNLLPHRDMDVGLLLIHEGGKYVEYPCLEWLRLRLTKEHTVGQVLTGGIPFPRLRRLWIDAGFPFGDDVVFGGNGRMLESLSLVVSGEVAGILHGVFTEASYPLLRSVKILVSGTNGWADTECLRFAMSIGPHALVRRIERGRMVVWVGGSSGAGALGTTRCLTGGFATCVLLLGLACPNFDYVAGGVGDGRQWLQCMMMNKLEEPEFKQYPRLRNIRIK
ncbi:hypothetical protein FBU31_000881, partial [Coemansia sp. 'formosensis']